MRCGQRAKCWKTIGAALRRTPASSAHLHDPRAPLADLKMPTPVDHRSELAPGTREAIACPYGDLVAGSGLASHRDPLPARAPETESSGRPWGASDARRFTKFVELVLLLRAQCVDVGDDSARAFVSPAQLIGDIVCDLRAQLRDGGANGL